MSDEKTLSSFILTYCKSIIGFDWGNPRTTKVSCKNLDPVRLIANLVTVGITALFLFRDLIKKEVCDLDVGLRYL